MAYSSRDINVQNETYFAQPQERESADRRVQLQIHEAGDDEATMHLK